MNIDENVVLYDVTKYTDAELYNILDMVNPTDRELEARILHLIDKYANMQNESGYNLAIFFQNIYSHFFETEDDDMEDEIEGMEIIDEKMENIDLSQISGSEQQLNNPNQTNINPETIKPIQNNKFKTLVDPLQNVSLTQQIDYSKDPKNLNPLLKTTIKRIISIDSQYRDNKQALSTEFTFNLSEPLKDVVSLKLYSIQLP